MPLLNTTQYLITPEFPLSRHMCAQITVAHKKQLLRKQLAVIGIVASLHLSVFASYLLQPEKPSVLINEMSISLADAAIQPVAPPKPAPKPIRQTDPLASEKPVEQKEEAPVTPPQEQVSLSPAPAPAPVAPDSEPDYKAEYLNNPRPPYPATARRMGYQGKVILRVEVLANGMAGQILLHTSSQYALLDDAAKQTVSTWRFTPAQHLGQAVTQWFLIPINFSLVSK